MEIRQVGLGIDTKALKDIGVNIYAMDISSQALKRVKPFVKASYLASNKSSLPDNYFNLAMSHLVVQHINDEEFRDQLKHVLRSLKSDGFYAFQFADSANTFSPDKQELVSQMSGGGCRSPDEVDEIVRSCGGEVFWRNVCWQGEGVTFHTFHVRRA